MCTLQKAPQLLCQIDYLMWNCCNGMDLDSRYMTCYPWHAVNPPIQTPFLSWKFDACHMLTPDPPALYDRLHYKGYCGIRMWLLNAFAYQTEVGQPMIPTIYQTFIKGLEKLPVQYDNTSNDGIFYLCFIYLAAKKSQLPAARSCRFKGTISATGRVTNY